MKKMFSVSLLLFVFICSTQLYSQGTRFGFKLGANYSQISSLDFDVVNIAGETPINAFNSVDEGRFGFSAAFTAEFELNKRISFQPEFAFSSQGNKFEGVRYDNLQLPLGLRINLNKLYFIAGPQVGLKISFFEQTDDFTSFDFSAFGSVGYFITDNLFLEARFTRGFLEVFEDDSAIVLPFVDEDDVSTTTSTTIANENNVLVNGSGTNQYFTFSIGYRI